MADLSNKPFLKVIRDLLSHGIQMIDNDECDEAKAMSMVARYNEETKGFFDKKSFVNYDKAMRIVGIKQRTKFKETCDDYGIEQKVINNQKVGFLRTEIEGLKNKIREENKKKTEV